MKYRYVRSSVLSEQCNRLSIREHISKVTFLLFLLFFGLIVTAGPAKAA